MIIDYKHAFVGISTEIGRVKLRPRLRLILILIDVDVDVDVVG